MTHRFILAIDQGTTGSRAIVYDHKGKIHSTAYQEFKQYYPRPGWVEHDAREIITSVRNVIESTLARGRLRGRQIAAIGITNQRETTVLWERKSGKPVGRAIVWQDRRTDEFCKKLRRRGLEPLIRRKTGLVLDPYFSGSKLGWIFDHHASTKRRARSGALAFGTIDSWLLFRLSGGSAHATDFTNASRTLLFDLRKKAWDSELCRIFGVPEAVLPEVKSSNALFAKIYSPLIRLRNQDLRHRSLLRVRIPLEL